MLGEVNNNNNQREKQQLIFRDMQALKGAQVSGLRDQLMQNYDVVLPTEFENQLKEMNNGVMPNDQQIAQMLMDGRFGNGPRVIDTNMGLTHYFSGLENQNEQNLMLNPNDSKVFGMGEDVAQMAMEDGFINDTQRQQSMREMSKDENQSFINRHQGGLEKDIEDGWRQDIVNQKVQEHELQKAREHDLRSQELGERSHNRKQRGQHLGGRFDQQELQDNLREQEREENKFQKAEPKKDQPPRGNFLNKNNRERNNNNIDGIN